MQRNKILRYDAMLDSPRSAMKSKMRMISNFLGFLIAAVSIGNVFNVAKSSGDYANQRWMLHETFAHASPSNSFVMASNTTISRETMGVKNSVWNSTNRLPKNESFGACLMVKDDNDLLYEWLAYHYVQLPLRHVYVGVDEGSTQDPNDILERWQRVGSDLNYWVVNSSTFATRHGELASKKHEDTSTEAHHQFIHRQRGFITSCTEFLKNDQGLSWVVYIDSDEFLVMNRLQPDEKAAFQSHVTNARANDEEIGISHQQPIDADVGLRQELPELGSSDDTTILANLHRIGRIHSFPSCYSMPRLLYGALENKTCPETGGASLAKKNFNYGAMSTLRFTQHAPKGDFAFSKFGKVMMDLSRLDSELVGLTPRNIHRPYKSACGPAVVEFAKALFTLNHYVGSWERYSSRDDKRRTREAWESKAFLAHGDSCHSQIDRWLPRFVDKVGIDVAAYLMGNSTSIVASTAITSSNQR